MHCFYISLIIFLSVFYHYLKRVVMIPYLYGSESWCAEIGVFSEPSGQWLGSIFKEFNQQKHWSFELVKGGEEMRMFKSELLYEIIWDGHEIKWKDIKCENLKWNNPCMWVWWKNPCKNPCKKTLDKGPLWQHHHQNHIHDNIFSTSDLKVA